MWKLDRVDWSVQGWPIFVQCDVSNAMDGTVRSTPHGMCLCVCVPDRAIYKVIECRCDSVWIGFIFWFCSGLVHLLTSELFFFFRSTSWSVESG